MKAHAVGRRLLSFMTNHEAHQQAIRRQPVMQPRKIIEGWPACADALQCHQIAGLIHDRPGALPAILVNRARLVAQIFC